LKQILVAAAKSLASSEALVLPVAKAADVLLGGRGCMVTFHRAAPSRDWPMLPNRDFYLDLGFLDQFLSYLKQNKWDVVTVEEALRRSASGDDASRYVNFSVDDCYRDTFEQVVPLFRRHNVPVTLFVTTGIPDATLPLWSAGLEDGLLHRDRVVLEDRTVELTTSESRRVAYDLIATAWDGPQAGDRYAAFCLRNGIDIDAMHWKHAISWEMLQALRDDPLVEIGGHTITHARISSLSPSEALAELQGCRERLIERLGVAVRHFAFPYGRAGDCGPRDFALARQAGFVSAATTRKGLVRHGQDAFDIPRNTINGAHRSLSMMQLHLSGLTGAAARMMGRV
jgi:peptidoglycan/xylan/chitin deacetylase (PgdA/CDA1 family)